METTSLARFYWLTLKGVATVIKGAIEIVLGLVALVASIAIWFSEDIAKKVSDFPTVNKWWCLGAIGLYFFHLWMKSMHAQFAEIEKKYFEMHKPTSLAGLCDRLENLSQIVPDTIWEELLQHAGDIVVQCHAAGGFRLDATAHDDIGRAKEERLFVQVTNNPIDPSHFGGRTTKEWYVFYVAAAAALRQIKGAPRGPDKALGTLPPGIEGVVYAAKVIAEYIRALRGEVAITIVDRTPEHSSTPSLPIPASSRFLPATTMSTTVSPFAVSLVHGYCHQRGSRLGMTTAHIRIHNQSARVLNKCQVRVLRVSRILDNGSILIPSADGSGWNRLADEQLLYWDATDGPAPTQINIPPGGDRTVTVLGFKERKYPSQEPYCLLLMGTRAPDGQTLGQGWMKLDISIESETDGVASMSYSIRIGFHERPSPTEPPPTIALCAWSDDWLKMIRSEAQAAQAERKRIRIQHRDASSSTSASPPSSSDQQPQPNHPQS